MGTIKRILFEITIHFIAFGAIILAIKKKKIYATYE